MKTAIVTDSTAYLPKDLREQHNIHMIPLNVIFGEESYQEEVELTAEQFYEEIKNRPHLPSTSQPAIGKFVELFESLAKDYDAIISIHLSSGISGTYQGALAAADMVDSAAVHVFDTEISCMVQGFYAIEAAEMAKEGKDADAIMARLQDMKKTMRAYFMVDDLSNLQRGGRLSSAQAFVGSLLQVKPLLHFVDKKIVPFEKIRTRKKAVKRILDLFDDDAKLGAPMRAVIIHGNQESEAEELKAELSEKYPNVEFYVSYFGPVIGTHLGEGALGVGWYLK